MGYRHYLCYYGDFSLTFSGKIKNHMLYKMGNVKKINPKNPKVRFLGHKKQNRVSRSMQRSSKKAQMQNFIKKTKTKNKYRIPLDAQ